IFWENLRVGNIIRIHEGETVPADIILLNCGKTEIAYFDTTKIDGKIRLKRKICVEETQTFCSPEMLLNIKGKILCKSPYALSEEFEGSFKLDVRPRSSPLHQKNFVCKGFVLRNTRSIDGVVVYTEGDKYLKKYSDFHPCKVSVTERVLNKYLQLIFGILVVLVLISILKGFVDASSNLMHGNEAVATISIIFCFHFHDLLPLSLFVCVDITRLILGWILEKDQKLMRKHMDGNISASRVYNVDLIDSLGQVDFFLTDKTGTLTENTMNLEICSVQKRLYYFSQDSSHSFSPTINPPSTPELIPKASLSWDTSPLLQSERSKESVQFAKEENNSFDDTASEPPIFPFSQLLMDMVQNVDDEEMIDHFLTALAICNT
ncbi:hypothetical protein IE077_000686, partial [Cardiosporidium cionae]